MRTLWLDTESFNAHGTIFALGGYEFARTGEPLLATCAWDDSDPFAIQPGRTPAENDIRRAALLEQVLDADRIIAHYAGYDRQVLLHQWDIETPIEQWRCSSSAARSAQLPGRLEDLCVFLQLVDDVSKMAEGKELIRLFCQLRHDDTRVMPADEPELFASFVRYGLRDVVAMRECWKRTPKSNYLRDLDVWFIDQHMNEEGLPVDLDVARTGYTASVREQKRLNGLLSKLTDGQVEKASLRQRFTLWAADRFEFLNNTQRSYLERMLYTSVEDEQVKRGIKIMLAAGRAAPSKYNTFLRATDETTDRFRGGFMYAGAQRTIRWSGQTVQPQNFFRPPPGFDVEGVCDLMATGDVDMVAALYPDESLLSVLAYAIRGVVTAPKGRKLVAADLSQIEARDALWIVGQDNVLEAFSDPDRDPYVEMAAASGSDDRQLGKVATLACGFGMGAPKFQLTAARDYGIEMSLEEAKHNVYTWRDRNPLVVNAWHCLTDELMGWLKTGRATEFVSQSAEYGQRLFERVNITCSKSRARMMIELPSGHVLHYYNVRVARVGDTAGDAYINTLRNDEGMTDDEINKVLSRVQLSYSGRTSGYRDRSYAWGGLTFENIVQSVARHVMVEGVRRIVGPKRWLTQSLAKLIGLFHDEVLLECPEDDADTLCAHACEMLSITPTWAPGLPLAAEGKVLRRYQK